MRTAATSSSVPISSKRYGVGNATFSEDDVTGEQSAKLVLPAAMTPQLRSIVVVVQEANDLFRTYPPASRPGLARRRVKVGEVSAYGSSTSIGHAASKWRNTQFLRKAVVFSDTLEKIDRKLRPRYPWHNLFLIYVCRWAVSCPGERLMRSGAGNPTSGVSATTTRV